MDQIQVQKKWTGFRWWALHVLMLISKWIVTFHLGVILWCQWVIVMNERWVTWHNQYDAKRVSWQHCAEPGANTTLITETCLCLLIMLSECSLPHFLHALLSSLSEISFHFQTGLPPVIAPSKNLPELSWPGWSWSAFVLTWTSFVGQLDSHQNLPS